MVLLYGYGQPYTFVAGVPGVQCGLRGQHHVYEFRVVLAVGHFFCPIHLRRKTPWIDLKCAQSFALTISARQTCVVGLARMHRGVRGRHHALNSHLSPCCRPFC